MTQPAMTAAEIDCYARHLTGASAVLEYGMGGSTIMAAERVDRLYSVESDRKWIAKVAEHPAVASMLSDGRAKLVFIDIGRTGAWGKPRQKSAFLKWPAYAERPWQDGYAPDLVFIDGVFRLHCIMQALKHGAPKVIVHDFWNRMRLYSPVLRFFSVVDRVDALAVLCPRAGAYDLRAKLLMGLYRYHRR